MPKNFPTLADISPTLGLNLDEKQAIEHFLGKTQDEAEILFRDHAIYYAEDLMWMGDKAFVFYFPAFSRFLESTHADGDADGLNSLASIIGFRVEHEPQSIADTKEPILSALQYCVDNYPKFGVEKTIYGDLRGKLLRLQKIVTELNPPVSSQAG